MLPPCYVLKKKEAFINAIELTVKCPISTHELLTEQAYTMNIINTTSYCAWRHFTHTKQDLYQ